MYLSAEAPRIDKPQSAVNQTGMILPTILHCIIMPDDSAHLYGGAIRGSNMPKRSSKRYSKSILESSALHDHHTILRQSTCKGGEDFWIKAWSMPDHPFTLPKHVVCRVMELGIAVHMRAMNVDKIIFRALSALSTRSTRMLRMSKVPRSVYSLVTPSSS